MSQIFTIETAGSQEMSDQEFAKYVHVMKNYYDVFQSIKGEKAPYFVPSDLVEKVKVQRRQLSVNATRHVTSTVFDTYYSKAELKSLRRIFIQDLLVTTWNIGRYILLRTIVEPYRINCVSSVVQDEQGNVCLLNLYNYTKSLSDKADLYLPRDTMLVIKEPYFGATDGGFPQIRCDSPSDVVVIHYQDENFKLLNVGQIQSWASTFLKDPVYVKPTPVSPLDWKNRGNELFKNGKYSESARAYSVGLECCQTDTGNTKNNEELLLKLNRAACYLKMERCDDAARDAVQVLDLDTDNLKALYRAARAFYKPHSFEKALPYFEKLATLVPNQANKESRVQCQLRLKEQNTGKFDFAMLEEKVQAAPSRAIRLDVADYFHGDAIEIRHISKERGRGVVAKKDIPPGTLLLVSKALAVSFTEEAKKPAITVVHLNVLGCSTNSQVHLEQSVIYKMRKCPSLAESVYNLWSGNDGEPSSAGMLDANGNAIIDYDRIHNICRLNSFSAWKDIGSEEKVFGEGLWVMASYFNNNCMPNVFRFFVGDVMVLYTSSFVKAGEELTLAYNYGSYERRQAHFHQYGFTCTCYLCTIQGKAAETSLQKALTSLRQTFETAMMPRVLIEDVSIIPTVEKHIASVKKEYEKHGRIQYLNEVIGPMCALARLYTAQGRTKEVPGIYKHVFYQSSNISDIDDYVQGKPNGPQNEPVRVVSNLSDLVVDIIHSETNTAEIKRWLRVVCMLEKITNGLDEPAVLGKYPDLFVREMLFL